MNQIPLKVLVVDSSEESVSILEENLDSLQMVLSVVTARTLDEARQVLDNADVNTIYIDPISLGVHNASSFILDTQKKNSIIVFVLYTDLEAARKTELFIVERGRFMAYCTLDKITPTDKLRKETERTVSLCQDDLSFNLTQERVTSLQGELARIQECASEESATVPISLLESIREQLDEIAVRDAKRTEASRLDSPASHLGAASPIKKNKCFVMIPYTQSWSEAIEETIRSICQEVGVEFSIARTGDGRVVAHDIWEGITSSAIIVADLTNANANVTYEVGLADAIGRSVVLIAQGPVSKIPFDFSGQRLIVYEDTIAGSKALEKELSEKLSRILQQGQ